MTNEHVINFGFIFEITTKTKLPELCENRGNIALK